MSAITDVIAALQSMIDELNDATSAGAHARSQTDQALAQAVALGTTVAIGGLSAIKDNVEKLTEQIAATVDLANEAITQAKAVADGS